MDNNPRNIVVILGNGFDLDLGLKTSYKDFWESEFCPKFYPAPLIYHLNQRWSDNLEAVRWYDLENELLNYYESIPNPKEPSDYITDEEKEFVKEYRPDLWSYGRYSDKSNLVQSLFEKGVLVASENRFCAPFIPYKEEVLLPPLERDIKALLLIKKRLSEYLQSLSRPEQTTNSCASYLLSTINSYGQRGRSVELFTFNYTSVAFNKKRTHYMHGNCVDGNIIIGTRDDVNMAPTYDFLQKGMDDDFSPPDIVSALSEADEVIIFGHSLGENDRQYFAPFFLKQTNYDSPVKKNIIIFTRDRESQLEIKRALQKMTNGNLSGLFSINQPIIIKTAAIEEDREKLRAFFIAHEETEEDTDTIIGKLHSSPKSSAKD